MKSFVRAHREYKQNLRMQRENQDTIDARMWVGFLQRLDEGDFSPDHKDPKYKLGVADTLALIQDFADGSAE
jgi:hypothetical protein